METTTTISNRHGVTETRTKAGATLTVKVANGREKAPGAGVVLTNADLFKTELRFADHKGACTFTGLPEGRYSAAAIDSRLDGGFGVALDYVLITSDQQDYDLALIFGRTGGIGNINVRVIQSGNPVQGAMVHIKSLDPAIQYDETRLTELPDGIAAFDPPDGTHKITVVLPSFAPRQQVVKIPTGLNTIVFEF